MQPHRGDSRRGQAPRGALGSRQLQDPSPPLLPRLLPPARPENQGKLNDAKCTPEGIFFPRGFWGQVEQLSKIV